MTKTGRPNNNKTNPNPDAILAQKIRKPESGVVFNDDEYLTKTNHHDSVVKDKIANSVALEKNARRRASRLAKFVATQPVKDVVTQPRSIEYYETVAEKNRKLSAVKYAQDAKKNCVKDVFEAARDKRVAQAMQKKVSEVKRTAKNLKKTIKKVSAAAKAADEELDRMLASRRDLFTMWDAPPEEGKHFELSSLCDNDEEVHEAGSEEALALYYSNKDVGNSATLDVVTGTVVNTQIYDFTVYIRRKIVNMMHRAHIPTVMATGRGTYGNFHAMQAPVRVVDPAMPYIAWSSLITTVSVWWAGPLEPRQKLLLILGFLYDQLGISMETDLVYNVGFNELISYFMRNIGPKFEEVLRYFEQWLSTGSVAIVKSNTVAFEEFDITDVTQGGFWAMLSNWTTKLIALLVSMNVKEQGIIKDILEFCKDAMKFAGVAEFFKSTIELARNIVDRGMLWYTTGDWRDFFLYDKATYWYAEAGEIIRICKRVRREVMSVEAQTLLLENVLRCIEVGKKILQVRGLKDKTYFAITSLVNQLDACHLDVSQSRTANQPHAQPFVVQLYSDSSMGKSSVVFALATSFMRSDGMKGDEINAGAIYNVNMRDQYDSQLKRGQPGFFANEVGALKANFDTGSMYMRLMAICDIMPCLANMADVADKGDFLLTFAWGLVTSNFRDCKAHQFLDNAYAFLRRLGVLVTITLQPEFRKKVEGATGFVLDKEKLGDRDVIEAQLWNIRLRESVNNKIIERIHEEAKHTYHEMINGEKVWMKGIEGMQVVVNLYAMHKRQQSHVVNNTTKYFSQASCEVCKQLFCICNCVPLVNPEPIIETVESTENVTVVQPSMRRLREGRNSAAVQAAVDAAVKLVKGDTVSVELITVGALGIGILIFIIEYIRSLFWKAKLEMEIFKKDVMEDLLKAPDLFANRLTTTLEPKLQYVRSLILTGLGSAASILVCYGIYRNLFAKKEDKPNSMFTIALGKENYEVEASKSFPYKYPKSDVKIQPQRILHVDNALILNGVTTAECLERKVRRATYKFVFTDIDGVNTAGVGTFLFGHFFLTCSHTLFGKTSGVMSLNNHIHTLKPCAVSAEQIIEIAKDMCLIFIQSVAPFADLRPYLFERTFEKVLNLSEGKIITFKNDKQQIAQNILEIEDMPVTKFTHRMLDCKTPSLVFTVEGIEATCKGVEGGHSGSIVICGTGIIGIVGIKSEFGAGVYVIPQIPDKFLETLPIYALPSIPPNTVSADVETHTSIKTILNHFVSKESPMVYFGTLKNYMFNPSKSNLRKSIAHDLVLDRFEGEIPIPGIPHARVIKDGNDFVFQDPMNSAFCELATINGIEPSFNVAWWCFADYFSIIGSIRPNEDKKGGPLTLAQALNSEVPFSRLPVNTAAGLGLGRKKKDYLIQQEDGSYILKPDALVKFNQFCQDFVEGRERPILSSTIKDELRKPKKVAFALERAFCASPFWFTLICRQYLMPVLVFMMDHCVDLEHCVGINAMSMDWDELYKYLNTHPNVLAGDFPHFDQSHLRIFMLLFHLFVRSIALTHLNYTEFDLRMLDRIVTNCIFYIVSVKGDLVEPSQGVGSGLPITIFINCFMASMYMRLAWISLIIQGVIEAKPFRGNNKLMTFGDDHVNNTNEKKFGFNNIKATLAGYGIGYTPADKSDSSDDFQPFSTVTFLKRGFLPATLLGKQVMLCPLERDSIWKSLLYVKCSLDIEKHQVAQNIVDAHKQFFFWGEDVFEAEKIYLKKLAHILDINIGEEGSKSSLRWMTHEEICKAYFSKTLTIAFV